MSRRDENGAVAPLVALLAVVLVLAVGFTIDLGTLAAETRRLQAASDLVALDAASELNGQPCSSTTYVNAGETLPTTLYEHIRVAAAASAARNGVTTRIQLPEAIRLTRDANGTVQRDSAGRALYTSLGQCAGSVTTAPDALRITAGNHVSYGFARVMGFKGADPTRSAIGLRDPVGAFEIGSSVTGVSASNETLMNQLLTVAFCSAYAASAAVSPGGSVSGPVDATYSGTVGGSTTAGPLVGTCQVSFTAVGYQGLAATSLTLGDLATQMGFASPAALLGSSVGLGQLFTGAANAVDCTGQPASCPTAKANMGALGTLLSSSSNTTATATLGDLIKVSSGSEAALLKLDLFSLLTGTAKVIDGEHFFSLGSATTPAAVNALGLSNSRVTVDLVEAPQYKEGHIGFSLTTAQARVTLDSDVLLPIPGYPSLSTHIRVSASGGGATGVLTGLRCGAPTKGIDVTVQTFVVQPTVEVTPGTLSIPVGPLVTLTLSATIGVTVTPTPGTGAVLSFLHPSEYRPTADYKHVGGTSLGLQSGTITVGIAGSGSTPAITTALQTGLNTSLTSLLTAIDSAVMSPLNKAFGLDIGSADVVAREPLKCASQTVAG
jgi:uncharacterized membrane protein